MSTYLSDAQTEHHISSLDELEKEITSQYNESLKVVSDRRTIICKMEKDSWKALDDEELACKDKIERIEKARDELVNKYYLCVDYLGYL